MQNRNQVRQKGIREQIKASADEAHIRALVNLAREFAQIQLKTLRAIFRTANRRLDELHAEGGRYVVPVIPAKPACLLTKKVRKKLKKTVPVSPTDYNIFT